MLTGRIFKLSNRAPSTDRPQHSGAPFRSSNGLRRLAVAIALFAISTPTGAQVQQIRNDMDPKSISLAPPDVKKGTARFDEPNPILQVQPAGAIEKDLSASEPDNAPFLLLHGAYVASVKPACDGVERLLFIRFSGDGTFYSCSIMRPPDVTVERLLRYEARLFKASVEQSRHYPAGTQSSTYSQRSSLLDLRAAVVSGSFVLDGSHIEFNSGIKCNGTWLNQCTLNICPSFYEFEPNERCSSFFFATDCGSNSEHVSMLLQDDSKSN